MKRPKSDETPAIRSQSPGPRGRSAPKKMPLPVPTNGSDRGTIQPIRYRLFNIGPYCQTGTAGPPASVAYRYGPPPELDPPGRLDAPPRRPDRPPPPPCRAGPDDAAVLPDAPAARPPAGPPDVARDPPDEEVLPDDRPPPECPARRSAFSFARFRSSAFLARISAIRSAIGTSNRCCGLLA